MQLDVVFCGFFLRNAQSARVQEKCGFRFYKQIQHETRYGSIEDTCLNLMTRKD